MTDPEVIRKRRIRQASGLARTPSGVSRNLGSPNQGFSEVPKDAKFGTK
jgi:hypothetical protein